MLETGERWIDRIKGVRLNASSLSHAELDEATELDDGDPQALGQHTGRICGALGHINIVGGCCGTDHRHIREMASCVLDTR